MLLCPSSQKNTNTDQRHEIMRLGRKPQGRLAARFQPQVQFWIKAVWQRDPHKFFCIHRLLFLVPWVLILESRWFNSKRSGRTCYEGERPTHPLEDVSPSIVYRDGITLLPAITQRQQQTNANRAAPCPHHRSLM